MPRVSIKSAARKASVKDAQARKHAAKVADSLQNFAANLGVGLDNQLTATTYGFNPITRNRTLLEWIHRGSWLGGVAVDVVAEDMTRAGVDIRGDIDPEDIEKIERAAITCNIWPSICDTVKWARLYGGALAFMLIDGQDPKTPLRLETIGKNQFKGLLVLDQWMVEPDLSNLVTEMGPDLGNPKFYNVTADAPAIPRMRIHHSRCLRLEGIRLPYYQRMMENLWGISVIERLYDRMIAFDSASTGAAQLVYRAYLRFIKIDSMREIIAAGGPGEGNLIRYVNFMRQMQSLEGVTLIDAKDDLAAMAQPSFAGLSDALIQFGQQLGGALQIPLTRLFGQSPVGMNATGESDLRTYYDGIKQQQNRWLLVPVTKIYRAMAASEGIKLGESFALDFRSLWILSDEAKALLGSQDMITTMNAYNAGLYSDEVALKELRQLSKTSGRGTNISDEMIAAANKVPSSVMAQEQHEMAMAQGMHSMGEGEEEKEGAESQDAATVDKEDVELIRSGVNEFGQHLDTQLGTGKHVPLFRRLAQSHTDPKTNKNATEKHWASVKAKNLNWYEHYQNGQLVSERSKLKTKDAPAKDCDEDAKLTHEKVKYGPGKGEERCENCRSFKANEDGKTGACQLVQSPIEPEGWCEEFRVKLRVLQ